jgi:hypothetical protein
MKRRSFLTLHGDSSTLDLLTRLGRSPAAHFLDAGNAVQKREEIGK